MFEWIKRRSIVRLEKSGGLEEKKKALEKTNEVANEVIRKMNLLKNEKRIRRMPFNGSERRLKLA